MKLNRIIAIIFLLIISLNAQNLHNAKNTKNTKAKQIRNWVFKIGGNYSAFRGIDNQIIQGISLGINRYWELTGQFKISGEILFTSQGGFLNDKPIRPQGDEIEWYLYSWDVRCKAYYIELPVLINYVYSIKALGLLFYIGPSYRFGLTEHSERTEEKLIYDDANPEKREEYRNYDFEFYQTDREFHAFPQSGFGLNIGTNITYWLLTLDLRYSYALHKIGGVEQLKDVNRKSHAVHFMLGYRL